MNLIEIALLAGYLTGIVWVVRLYETVPLPSDRNNKRIMRWYRFGYIMATLIWPIFVVAAILRGFIEGLTKDE